MSSLRGDYPEQSKGLAMTRNSYFFGGSMKFERLLVSICFTVAVMLGGYGLAVAEQKQLSDAAKQIQETVRKIKEVLETGRGKKTTEEIDRQLEGVVFPAFDFEDMSRRSIGANWSSGTAEQQREFVKLFSELLSRTYLDKIKKVENRIVDIVKDVPGDGKALVKTIVRGQNEEDVQLDYRLSKATGEWRIYDVIIENIGLVTNYRSEFASIINERQFSGLLEQLREKRQLQKDTPA